MKVTPFKGVTRFGKRGKLNPRYVEPFSIGEIENLAYRIALAPAFSVIHNVFHISMLKKYVFYPTYILVTENLLIQEHLNYEERPIKILDHTIKKLRNQEIEYVKVQWNHYTEIEATWELREEMERKYPQLFKKT